MKVLHVYRTYFPETQGGLEETIRQICRGTAGLGVQSKVMALAASAREARVDDVDVHFAHQNFEVASCGIGIGAIPLHHRLVDWADLVNYHFPWPFADLLYFTGQHYRSGPRKPAVLTYHSDIVRQRLLGLLYRPLMSSFLRSVERLVCTSPNYFATSDVLSAHPGKVDVIPIGIDEVSYPQASEELLSACRAEYGHDFFLFVGVLRYYKGLHILLDAIRGTNLQVVIAGSGPIEQELRNQARVLQLDNVRFLGHVSDEKKCALFQLSRAVVFPSYLRAEAFGVTLLEGSMFGKPLISTEVGSGTSHVNIHGESGLVVTPGHARELRDAMLQLAGDRALAEVLGRGARQRYERMFTGQLMSQRYHALYSELLRLPKGAALRGIESS